MSSDHSFVGSIGSTGSTSSVGDFADPYELRRARDKFRLNRIWDKKHWVPQDYWLLLKVKEVEFEDWLGRIFDPGNRYRYRKIILFATWLPRILFTILLLIVGSIGKYKLKQSVDLDISFTVDLEESFRRTVLLTTLVSLIYASHTSRQRYRYPTTGKRDRNAVEDAENWRALRAQLQLQINPEWVEPTPDSEPAPDLSGGNNDSPESSGGNSDVPESEWTSSEVLDPSSDDSDVIVPPSILINGDEIV